MRNDQIAVQLYTVRDLAAQDLPGTLRRVASAGYRAVEVAGLPRVAAAALRTMLDDEGLQVVAAHHALADFRRDRNGSLDALATIGAPRVIVPWLAEEDRGSPDAVRAVAVELAGISDAAASHGISLGYHNHDFEFAPIGGTTAWDVLLDALPPSVEIELDVYWAARAGRDPAALIADLGNRVRLLHMKDLAGGPEGKDAPAGDGVLAWDAIVAAARGAGVEWYIVEQDNPGDDPIAAITRGRDYLLGKATAAVS